jgi:hypothetical protein
MQTSCLGFIIAAGLTFPAFGQGVDPLVGTWKLNLAKSTFVGVPAVKSQTLTFIEEGQNLINTAEGVNSQGRPFKVILMHIYDGQLHPVTGSPAFDSNIFNRIGNSINGVRFKNGKVVEIGQMQLVPGKTYTSIEEGITANGQSYRTVRVYERQ